MARPRNSTPQIHWAKDKEQFCIYLNRKRVLLGADRDQAEQKRKAIIRRMLSPAEEKTEIAPAGGSLTFSEALGKYRTFAIKHYKDKRAISRIDCAIAVALENAEHAASPIEQVDRATLAEIRDSLIDRANLSRRYINHLVTAIKTAFTWMVERRIVPASALYEVRALKRLSYQCGGVERPKVPPVAQDVVDKTLPFCPPNIQAMIRFQQCTGLRPGELVIMRRCDVSTSPTAKLNVPFLENPVSAQNVNGQLIWVYAPPQHKGIWREKSRTVMIGPEAQKILAPILMAREPDEYVFRPSDSFHNERGRHMIRVGLRYKVRSYYEAVRRAIARFNRKVRDDGRLLLVSEILPRWFPHQLRHRLGTNAAEQVDAESAGLLLGHSASRRATETYVEDSLRRAAEAAAKVG